MIIVKLMGGLGNQMFQYAAARRLSNVNNVPLKFDLDWFEDHSTDIKREYELNIFNIQAEIATPDEIGNLKEPAGKPPLFSRIKKKLQLNHKQTHIRQKHYHFDPDILKLGSNIYFEGYWQSEKYFKDINDIIRKEFTLKPEPDRLNRKMADSIRSSDSISLHVRRGDYISNEITNKYHGTCSPEYYNNTIEIITSKVKTPHFFVFSDEPEWTKENLDIKYPATYIDHNGPENAYEDLRLMSLCKHHIIANSSFSWWGAWLNPSPDKIVIAPSKWFSDSSINTNDLIPGNWIRI